MLNLIHENGIKLESGERDRMSISFKSQNDLVFDLFVRLKTELTAEDALAEIQKHQPKAPITSARRAINYLLNTGVIEKTENKKRGSMGIGITAYRLVTKQLIMPLK